MKGSYSSVGKGKGQNPMEKLVLCRQRGIYEFSPLHLLLKQVSGTDLRKTTVCESRDPLPVNAELDGLMDHHHRFICTRKLAICIL